MLDVDGREWCNIIMIKSSGGRALIHEGVYHLSEEGVNRKIHMVEEDATRISKSGLFGSWRRGVASMRFNYSLFQTGLAQCGCEKIRLTLLKRSGASGND